MASFVERMNADTSFDGECKSVVDSKFGSVLVIYTGGTIGMKLNNDGVYVSEKDFLHSWLTHMPMFHDPEYAEHHKKLHKDPPFIDHFRWHPLYLPVTSGNEKKHIQYIIYEYTHLVDSSNVDADTMLQIALDIKKFYRKFDAFVILHGTDTMCYTASAMSFILENLGKPVIITGSQIPIYETRSDGRENLLGALIMAASFVIPEVCVYFNHYLIRGNRARKVSADTLDAFDSPNFPILGSLEVKVTVYWDLIKRPSTTKQFNVHTLLSSNVAVLRVFPNLSAAVVRAMLQDPIEGVVMQCYGAGNFPDDNVELLEVLKEACRRGVIIVNTTQCRRGTVSISYAGAKSLLDVGIVAGYDMTSEAALAKLSYVLTKPWSVEEKRKFVSQNVAGELTTHTDLPQQRHLSEALTMLGFDLDMVGTAVETMSELRETMIMPLICMSIKRGDMETLDKICEKYPGNILTNDYDNRTPLHVAIRDGSYQTVKYLLKHGASVHAKDSFDRTPLTEAIEVRRFDVIELLVKSGAHLHLHPEELAIELNKAASRGDLELITAYWNAGAKLNVWDYNGRTPLHVAVLNDQIEIIDYMIIHGSNPLLCDDSGSSTLMMTMNVTLIAKLDSAVQMERWVKLRRRPTKTDFNTESISEVADVASLVDLHPPRTVGKATSTSNQGTQADQELLTTPIEDTATTEYGDPANESAEDNQK